MSRADLHKAVNIAPNTMTKLRCDEEVSLSVFEKNCSVLGANIGEIMDFIDDSLDT